MAPWAAAGPGSWVAEAASGESPGEGAAAAGDRRVEAEDWRRRWRPTPRSSSRARLSRCRGLACPCTPACPKWPNQTHLQQRQSPCF